MSSYFWKLELSFLASIVNYVTTLLAALYVIPHQQYIPPYFKKMYKWHPTIQTMSKHGCKINERMLQTTSLSTLVEKGGCIYIPQREKNHYYNNISLPWAPAFFLLDHLFCLSHYKTHWTMSMNNVDLTTSLLGTSNFIITMTFFSW